MSNWTDTILHSKNPAEAWKCILEQLKDIAINTHSAVSIHKATVEPDRLLAESAWELWESFQQSAIHTSDAVKQWWNDQHESSSRAVLILDALSIRELAPLLAGAAMNNIDPEDISITCSEVPSDTNSFALSLGVSSRSSISNNKTHSTFVLEGDVYTEVLNLPFEDCLGSIPAVNNIFIWHSWLDDLIHVHKRLPDQIYKTASEVLQSEGFWKFINKLRQGRKLLITSDHGYAVGRQFSTEISDSKAVAILKEVFGASRYTTDKGQWNHHLMPPTVLKQNGKLTVMGQTKWRVQGGFPQICHGGLSLLEVAVPFIELSSI